MKTPMKFCILSMLMVCASALTLSSQPLPRDGRLAASADSAAKASVANAERPDRSVFIKTNPVGWGLLIGNAGVECDLNHNLSAEFWIYYSALNYFSRTTKFRTLAFTPMLKWWPGTTGGRWWADVHLGPEQAILAHRAVRGGVLARVAVMPPMVRPLLLSRPTMIVADRYHDW